MSEILMSLESRLPELEALCRDFGVKRLGSLGPPQKEQCGFIMRPMEERDQAWREFEAMARRPLSQRIRYGFVHTYKPVLDDEPYRSFETMEEYRQWCEANLPAWLGFARV